MQQQLSNSAEKHPEIVVETTRANTVENTNPVIAAIADHSGVITHTWGDATRVVPVRSSVKALQALALVDTGAADAFAVSERELSLAASSHNGEKAHVEAVESWLSRIGLNPDHLLCGPAAPLSAMWPSFEQSWISEKTPTKHNCSGKHAGFLTLCLHLGADPATYLMPHEPTQQAVLARFASRCGIAIEELDYGTDGCGAPAPAVPLVALAKAIASLANENDPAAARIVSAIEANPFELAGTTRFDTAITTALGHNGYSKVGADGVRIVLLRKEKLAIAMKALSSHKPAVDVAMAKLLCDLQAIDANDESLQEWVRPSIKNNAGKVVGEVTINL